MKLQAEICGSGVEVPIERRFSEFGWEVTGPFYREDSIVEPNSMYVRGRGQVYYARLKEYLCRTVIIRDAFGTDHDARRAFEQANPDAHTYASQYDKLGGGKFLACIADMEGIIGINRQYPSVQEKLRDVAQLRLLGGKQKLYNDMETEAKIELTMQMDRVVFEFLAILAEPSPDSESEE